MAWCVCMCAHAVNLLPGNVPAPLRISPCGVANDSSPVPDHMVEGSWCRRVGLAIQQQGHPMHTLPALHTHTSINVE